MYNPPILVFYRHIYQFGIQKKNIRDKQKVSEIIENMYIQSRVTYLWLIFQSKSFGHICPVLCVNRVNRKDRLTGFCRLSCYSFILTYRAWILSYRSRIISYRACILSYRAYILSYRLCCTKYRHGYYWLISYLLVLLSLLIFAQKKKRNKI